MLDTAVKSKKQEPVKYCNGGWSSRETNRKQRKAVAITAAKDIKEGKNKAHKRHGNENCCMDNKLIGFYFLFFYSVHIYIYILSLAYP